MAKKKQVETLATIVLDRSGSMGVVQDKTISGFNEYIQDLKGRPEKFSLTTVMFGGHETETIYDNVPLDQVKELTRDQYEPDGSTPLLDAIGRTIERVEQQVVGKKQNVIVMIMTDGEENASTDFDNKRIAEMIKDKETAGGWVFTYMGANQDSFAAAKNLNIDMSNVGNYSAAQPDGAFVVMAAASATYARSGGAQVKGLIDTKEMLKRKKL